MMYEHEEYSQAYDNQVHGHIRLGETTEPTAGQHFFLGVASSIVAGLVLLYFCDREA